MLEEHGMNLNAMIDAESIEENEFEGESIEENELNHESIEENESKNQNTNVRMQRKKKRKHTRN